MSRVQPRAALEKLSRLPPADDGRATSCKSLFGTINNIYLGQMIGVDALAAVTVFFPVMFAFIALRHGPELGRRRPDRPGFRRRRPRQGQGGRRHDAERALLFAAAIALFGSVCSRRQLLIALATPQNILEAATSYARVTMIFMPLPSP